MSDTPYMIDATIRVPGVLWCQFHAACLAHDTLPSIELCAAMEDILQRWATIARILEDSADR